MVHVEKHECCGCGACAQRCPLECISMREDKEGFLYPEISQESCTECNLCDTVCPALNQGKNRRPIRVYAAKTKNEELRLQSSSGGIFTLLAENVIERDGVVFGVRFNRSWEVVHDYAKTKEQLSVFRGSKYVQSKVGDSYQQVEHFLKAGCFVLFSGTPCQIAGLKLFLGNEYKNLVTVDLVCHGVPSPKVWQKYISKRIDNHGGYTKKILKEALKKTAISDIRFRDKRNGWKVYTSTFQFENNTDRGCSSFLCVEKMGENIFLRGFMNDLYLRPICYACPYRCLKSGSDITIGDFWGVENVLPEFDDNKGVSLVMINTSYGETIYQSIQTESVETFYLDAIVSNPNIEKSVACPKNRERFMRNIDNVEINKLIIDCTNPSCISYVHLFLKKILKTILSTVGLLERMKKLSERVKNKRKKRRW